SSRRRHTRFSRDWSSDVCSSDLDTYVAGTSPLPIEEVLGWAGVDFLSEAQSGDSTVSLGSIGLGLNDKQQLMVADNSHMNAFGRSEERRVGKEWRYRVSPDD